MHSTNDLNDGYVGSGKRLWFSINYHGKENHEVEILEYCQNRKELSKREEEIVNEQLINQTLCMNLVTGGHSGQQGFVNEKHRIKCQIAGQKALTEKLKNNDNLLKKRNLSISSSIKKAHEEGKMKTWSDTVDWTGKKHSEETKLKMSESKKGKGKGETNSQYGSCWITNEIENKKIKRGDAIPKGFRLGRVK
jgi:hypothetical protein